MSKQCISIWPYRYKTDSNELAYVNGRELLMQENGIFKVQITSSKDMDILHIDLKDLIVVEPKAINFKLYRVY